jgi:Uma2 family endonuclease
MSTAPKAPPITVEQYLAFQEPPGFRSELLHGEIILSPDPKPIHHDIVFNVIDLLRERVEPQFKVCSRINVDYAAEYYMPSPDVFVIERGIWRQCRERNEYPQGHIILAVEVISPSNREANVADKTACISGTGQRRYGIFIRLSAAFSCTIGTLAGNTSAKRRLLCPHPCRRESSIRTISSA